MINNWIFLRGLTRGNIHWGDFPDLFHAAHPEATVEYLEIPGNGLLFDKVTPTDPQEVINFLKSNSSLVQSGVTFHLCGISLGGMLALKWAQLNPDQVESVIVINSSLTQFSAFHQRLKPKTYLQLLAALLDHDSYKQEEIILRITSNKFEQNKKYLNSYGRFSSEHPVGKANFIRQLLLAKNINLLPFPNNKLKVISAAQDQLVASTCSAEIARGLNGRLIIHPTSGHDLPLDEPNWLIEQLLAHR